MTALWTARCYAAYSTGDYDRLVALVAEAEAADDHAGIEVCRAWRGDFIAADVENAKRAFRAADRLVA